MPWWDDFLFWVHGYCTVHVQVYLPYTLDTLIAPITRHHILTS
jgi:hypothetical protein